MWGLSFDGDKVYLLILTLVRFKIASDRSSIWTPRKNFQEAVNNFAHNTLQKRLRKERVERVKFLKMLAGTGLFKVRNIEDLIIVDLLRQSHLLSQVQVLFEQKNKSQYPSTFLVDSS